MYKGFDFQVGYGSFDFGNIIQACFASEDNPGETEVTVQLGSLRVDAIGLGAQVVAFVRKVAPQHPVGAQVADDESVEGIAGNVLGLCLQGFQIFIVEKNVHRAVELAPALYTGDLFPLFGVKVVGPGAQRKRANADVGGIRSV